MLSHRLQRILTHSNHRLAGGSSLHPCALSGRLGHFGHSHYGPSRVVKHGAEVPPGHWAMLENHAGAAEPPSQWPCSSLQVPGKFQSLCCQPELRSLGSRNLGYHSICDQAAYYCWNWSGHGRASIPSHCRVRCVPAQANIDAPCAGLFGSHPAASANIAGVIIVVCICMCIIAILAIPASGNPNSHSESNR